MKVLLVLIWISLGGVMLMSVFDYRLIGPSKKQSRSMGAQTTATAPGRVGIHLVMKPIAKKKLTHSHSGQPKQA